MEWIFVVVIAVLQVIDALLTYAILKNGGRELWAPQKWIQDKLGLVPALVLTKLAVVGTSIGVAWYVPSYKALLVLLYFIATMYAVVGFSNLSVWREQK